MKEAKWIAIEVIRRPQLRERTKVEEQNEEAGGKPEARL